MRAASLILSVIFLDGTNKNSYNGCSEEEREYIELIENIITNNGILDTSRLSSDDEDSQKWATGNISLYEYLHYAVGKDAVSVSALDISNTFLSSDEIYAALAEYILLDLEENKSFSKIVYESMLNQGYHQRLTDLPVTLRTECA